MAKLDAEIRIALEVIPANRRTVIPSHDAFGYFAQAYGIRFISIAGLSSEAEPSAKDLAAIIDRAKKEHVARGFVAVRSRSQLVQQVAGETGARERRTLSTVAWGAVDAPAGARKGGG